MKIYIHCFECYKNAGQGISNSEQFTAVPLGNSPIYTVKCKMDHCQIIQLCNLQFELLFDSAINAYHDGYIREAVSSFYASLENFYKEITRYLIVTYLPNISNEARTKAFTPLLKYSERNLGAFTAIYLALTGEAPVVFETSQVSFRNNVIHGSEYPSEVKTIVFANKIRDFIFQTLENINKVYPISMGKIQGTLNKLEPAQEVNFITTIRTYLSQYALGLNKLEDIEEYHTTYQSYREKDVRAVIHK